MTQVWSKKREEQHRAIRDRMHDNGAAMDRVEEIADRVENKQRRFVGEIESAATRGTGNPDTRLDMLTKDELYSIARQYDLEGRSKMTKDKLISAIRHRQGTH